MWVCGCVCVWGGGARLLTRSQPGVQTQSARQSRCTPPCMRIGRPTLARMRQHPRPRPAQHLWCLFAEADHVPQHAQERWAGHVLALRKDCVEVVAAPLEAAIVHGQREGHIAGLRVHAQALQEAHEVGVRGEIVHLQCRRAAGAVGPSSGGGGLLSTKWWPAAPGSPGRPGRATCGPSACGRRMSPRSHTA